MIRRASGIRCQGAAFVGGGDEPEQQLGSGVVQRGEAELIDLCGCPHSWTYADPATMPAWAAGRWPVR